MQLGGKIENSEAGIKQKENRKRGRQKEKMETGAYPQPSNSAQSTLQRAFFNHTTAPTLVMTD